MIKVTTALPCDVDGLELSEIFEHADALMYGKLAIMDGAPAFSIFDDDKLLGIVGGIYYFPGVAEVFALLSKDIKGSRGFHKAVKTLVDGAFEEFKVHRLQMVVRADFTMGKKWASSLGFEPEGLMKKYGPNGDDYVLFGRVK